MRAFIILASLASVILAKPLVSRAPACAHPEIFSSTKLSNGVLHNTLGCPDLKPAVVADGYGPSTTVTDTATATVTVTPTPSPTKDVRGLVCNTVCGELTSLPPIENDCLQIIDAVTILQLVTPPTFVVAPQSSQELVFGTCRIFFENLSLWDELYDWLDLVNQASAVGTTCFPPTQPINTLAECKAPDSTWVLGVSHSNDGTP